MKKLLLVLITCFAITQNLKSAFLVAGFQALKGKVSGRFATQAPKNIVAAVKEVIAKDKEVLAQKAAERQAVIDRQTAMDNLPVKPSKNRIALHHNPSERSTAAVVMLRRFGAKYPRK
ncbi:MAG: hypothetical protein EBU90_05735 [Proteobacteria bacterium]|nr:hypothetical protein [Pseudomonadota bacterium]